MSEYAESRIIGLDSKNPNDVKSLNAGDILEISKENGGKFSIPFYKTSYYQNNFCNPAAPIFNSVQLSAFEIELLKDTYYKTLIMIRTPEFQDCILSKPAGIEQGLVFREKARNLKRGVYFISSPANQGIGGLSNMWSIIHISHWGISPGYTNYLEFVSHELFTILVIVINMIMHIAEVIKCVLCLRIISMIMISLIWSKKKYIKISLQHQFGKQKMVM